MLATAFDPDRDWTWLKLASARLSRQHPGELKPRRGIDAFGVNAWAEAEIVCGARHAGRRQLEAADPLPRRADGRPADRPADPAARPSSASRSTGTWSTWTTGCWHALRAATTSRTASATRGLPAAARLWYTAGTLSCRVPPGAARWPDEFRGSGFPGREGRSATTDCRRTFHDITSRAFGRSAPRPHAFRDIAATSIAEEDPAHVNIIADILGHSTSGWASSSYNRASGVKAARRPPGH